MKKYLTIDRLSLQVQRVVDHELRSIFFDMNAEEVSQLAQIDSYSLGRLNCAALSWRLASKLRSDSSLSELSFRVIPFAKEVESQFYYPYDHVAIGCFIEDEFVALIDPSFGINHPLTDYASIVTARWQFSVGRDEISWFLRGTSLASQANGAKRRLFRLID